MALKVSGGGGDSVISTGRTIDVRDRYEIDSSKPLPALDSKPAVAYTCIHKRDSKRSLYALVCDPKLAPRQEVVSILRRLDHRCLMRALDWDVIDWPPEGRRCPVVILEKPGGKRIFESLDQKVAPLQEEVVMRRFIEPACQILRDMNALDTSHRMLRPDNLFWMGEPGQEIMIGECFSSPAGITNPLVYETLECSLASVAGRGEGDISNDLYALGVCILALLTGESPLHGVSDADVVQKKLSAGSYGAIIQHHRVSLTMMEPLRGLLNDDPHERWTLEDLFMWLNGRRLSPKQQVMPTKAARGLTIAGKDYSTAREVANALHRNWEQAAAHINSGSLDTWLRRSLGDEDTVESVNLAKSGAGDNQDKLIARVLIALDPDGPVRLKSYSATIEGHATLIGAFYGDQAAQQLFSQVISMGLVPFWMEQQRRLEPQYIRHMNRLEKVRSVLTQPGLGFGIERVVYELNPQMNCLSPLFERDFVPSVESIVPAIDRLCAADTPPEQLIDRHIAAFLGTHLKRSIGIELRNIDRDPDSEEGRISQVQILAILQDSLHRDQVFLRLCGVAASVLEPAVSRFHSRAHRKSVRIRIMKAARTGKLQELLDIIDNDQEVDQDQQAFDVASNEYAVMTHQLIGVMTNIHNKPFLAEEYGGQMANGAAMLGCIAAVALAGFAAFF